MVKLEMVDIVSYWKVTKPRLWFLLVYTGMAGYLIASKGLIDMKFFLTLLALITGTAGANVVTSYIDRDIDAIMIRTMKRPIPSGKIYPAWKALIYGLILVTIAIISSYLINIYALAFMLFGLFDNIIIYSAIFKRRNPINIIVGSFSGGAPAVIGYTAYSCRIDLLAIVLAALIVVWTPVHIWSLALYYRDDYKRAGVPMLPVVTSVETAIRCIASTSILLVVFSYLIPALHTPFNTIGYYIPVTVINIILLYIALRLIIKPNLRWSWRLFKVTSPYLGIIFTVMMLLSFM